MELFKSLAFAILCASPFIFIVCIVRGISNAYKNIGEDDPKN